MADSFRLAFGTLTALPVRAPTGINRRTAGRAMLLAPLSAVTLAILPAAVVLLTQPWDRPELRLPSAVLVVALLALQTRAFHLDGLADTVDGLSASYDRERALAVMRTGDVGPAGAAALVLILGLQIAALGSLLSMPQGAVLAAVALVSSRLALTCGCAGGRAARTSGLGATVTGSVSMAAATALGVVVMVGAALLAQASAGEWWVGASTVFVAVVACAAMRYVAHRRLGGWTGDVLGATVEISLAASLFIALALS